MNLTEEKCACCSKKKMVILKCEICKGMFCMKHYITSKHECQKIEKPIIMEKIENPKILYI